MRLYQSGKRKSRCMNSWQYRLDRHCEIANLVPINLMGTRLATLQLNVKRVLP